MHSRINIQCAEITSVLIASIGTICGFYLHLYLFLVNENSIVVHLLLFQFCQHDTSTLPSHAVKHFQSVTWTVHTVYHIKACVHCVSACDCQVHAYVISHMKKEMPSMFGKDSRKKELISNLGNIFAEIQREHQISPGDFPDLARMQEQLQHHVMHQSSVIIISLNLT